MVQILEVVRAFSAKKFFPERIFSDDPPPRSPKNFRSVYHFRGRKIFFGTSYKFSRYHKISHEIYANSHKIVIICPIFLYNKTILPDYGANIARLALFAQQTGWSGANPCIKDHFNGIRKIREIFKTNRETWRSA